jgi:MFS family permease
MSASAIGGMMVPLLVWYVDAVGWRTSIFWVGVGFWIIGIPAIIMMTRTPEDKGMLPDGDPVIRMKSGALQNPVVERRIPVMTALKTRFFWQLSIGTSLGHLVSSTTLLHIDAMQTFDVSRTTASLAVFGFAVGSFVGRLGMGFIGDYVDKRYLLAISFNMQILGVLGLVSLNATVGGVFLGQWGLIIYAAFFGAGFGSSIPVRMAMIGDYFGRQTYGSMLGLMSTANAAIGAFGPVFVGIMFDVTGSYRMPFLLLIIVLLASGPMMLTLETPARVKARFRIALHNLDLAAAEEAKAEKTQA